MLVTKIRAKEIRTMTHDLTTGKPLRDIWQFAVPVLFGLLLQQVYSLVDTAIVGHALGVMALGGVGATSSVNFLVIGFSSGLCTGMSIPIAQTFGAGDYRALRRYIGNCVWLSAIASALLLALTLPVMENCRPTGTPIPSKRSASALRNFQLSFSIRSTSKCFFIYQTQSTPETACDTTVAMAAPATPIFRP